MSLRALEAQSVSKAYAAKCDAIAALQKYVIACSELEAVFEIVKPDTIHQMNTRKATKEKMEKNANACIELLHVLYEE